MWLAVVQITGIAPLQRKCLSAFSTPACQDPERLLSLNPFAQLTALFFLHFCFPCCLAAYRTMRIIDITLLFLGAQGKKTLMGGNILFLSCPLGQLAKPRGDTRSTRRRHQRGHESRAIPSFFFFSSVLPLLCFFTSFVQRPGLFLSYHETVCDFYGGAR